MSQSVSRPDTGSRNVVATVNGVPHELPHGTTLASFLVQLGVRRDGTAIARNAEVVARGRFDETFICDGDRIEIISAVAGG